VNLWHIKITKYRPVIPVRLLGTAVLATILMGCEARLDLEGIQDTLDQPIRRTDQLMSLQQFSNKALVLLGDNGLVLTRDAESEEWQRQQLLAQQIAPDFIDSALCSDGSVAALSYQGAVWLSSDQGKNWQNHQLPTSEEMQAIACTAAGDLWVVGSFSTLLHSSDQGANWQENSMGEDSMLTSVKFISPERGYVTGEFGLFIVTEDGGANWQSLDPISDEFYPLSSHFSSDGKNAWVGGLQGVIFHSEDSGQTWQRQQVASEAPIYNFIDVAGQLIATGDQGTVLRLSGNSWNRVPSPEIPTYFRTGVALNDQSLLIAGGWGVLVPLKLEEKL